MSMPSNADEGDMVGLVGASETVGWLVGADDDGNDDGYADGKGIGTLEGSIQISRRWKSVSPLLKLERVPGGAV
jgi:hypothetical protein